eukprot:TRINITY_DN21_c0_g1_i4.p1 TRINITY_DN21_c0_g1~~TRINITY_DN21_c0_g1_i4.p1  ORF type:complete len:957 (-),score=239.74 TRINITY_DN21_c0_g1_i4:70-2736(-)
MEDVMNSGIDTASVTEPQRLVAAASGDVKRFSAPAMQAQPQPQQRTPQRASTGTLHDRAPLFSPSPLFTPSPAGATPSPAAATSPPGSPPSPATTPVLSRVCVVHPQPTLPPMRAASHSPRTSPMASRAKTPDSPPPLLSLSPRGGARSTTPLRSLRSSCSFGNYNGSVNNMPLALAKSMPASLNLNPNASPRQQPHQQPQHQQLSEGWKLGAMNAVYSALRQKFSADKTRFCDGKCNLDLTYITDRIIAMSFPSDGLASTYRNFIDDVAAMLNRRHAGRYRIYNLSGKPYDYTKFNNSVQDWCCFPDHHAPPFCLMLSTINDMHEWLSRHPLNVVAVNCMAGKGRTGTVIAGLLLLSGLFGSADAALDFFAAKRSCTRFGVTYPSQRRYAHYVSLVVHWGVVPSPAPLRVRHITLRNPPVKLQGNALMKSELVLSFHAFDKLAFIADTATVEQKGGETTVRFDCDFTVWGDVMVSVETAHVYKNAQLLRFSFHTGFVKNNIIRLEKHAVDLACDDHRFSDKFGVDVTFEDVPPQSVECPALETYLRVEESLVKATLQKKGSDGGICWVDEASPTLQEKIKLAHAMCGQAQGVTLEKSGYLHRLENSKYWKRRWVTLINFRLTCYSSPKGKFPLFAVPVDAIADLQIPCGSSRQNGFTLVLQQDSLVLHAESSLVMQEWLEALHNSRAQCLALPPHLSPPIPTAAAVGGFLSLSTTTLPLLPSSNSPQSQSPPQSPSSASSASPLSPALISPSSFVSLSSVSSSFSAVSLPPSAVGSWNATAALESVSVAASATCCAPPPPPSPMPGADDDLYDGPPPTEVMSPEEQEELFVHMTARSMSVVSAALCAAFALDARGDGSSEGVDDGFVNVGPSRTADALPLPLPLPHC